MKKVILATFFFFLIAGSIALAQNECDQAYVKAMTANTPAERISLLKEFLSACGGKGSQYENFANANLCVTGWQGKTEQETLNYGEKALVLGGLDDVMKCQVMTQLCVIYNKQAQNLDKVKAYATQMIQTATAAKSKDPEGANWNTLIGLGHFFVGQAQEKTKDTRGAIDSYIASYGILKDAKILVELKKIAKAQYEAKLYADAEKVFRFLAQANPKDTESQSLVAQCLYKAGKTNEALAMWKDSFAKTKSGDMAYNIGITLAKEAKTNPALTNDAIRYLLDASLLSPSKSKEAMGLAEALYYGADKEWNNRVKDLQERQKLIEEWTKTINTRFGDKSEDDLTSDERREFRKIKENIDKEIKDVEKIQAQQKTVMDGFNKILAEEKQKLGIR